MWALAFPPIDGPEGFSCLASYYHGRLRIHNLFVFLLKFFLQSFLGTLFLQAQLFPGQMSTLLMDRAFVFICILVPIYVDIPFHWNIFILEAGEVMVQAWGSLFDTQQVCKKPGMSLTSVLGASLVKWQGPAQRPLSQPAYKMERSDLHICTHRQAHPSHAEAAIGYTGKRHSLQFIL